MKLLLDTHVLLWWLEDSPRLPARVRHEIGDPSNDVLWSAASTLELAIKATLDKIRLRVPLARYVPTKLRELSIDSLPIEDAHALRVADLPLHHRDPFDRILIAQALVEQLTIATADETFGSYEVEVVWN